VNSHTDLRLADRVDSADVFTQTCYYFFQARYRLQTVSETCVQCVRHSDPRHSKRRFHYLMINEAPWQSASLQHDRLLQLINGVKLPAVVKSVLHGPKWCNPPNLNAGCWAQVRLNAGDILTPQYAIRVSRNVRWRTVLLQSSLVAPSSVLCFHEDKIGIMSFVALCSLYVPKSVNFIDAFSCRSKNESWPV